MEYINTTIGNYKLIRLIGEGGMAKVYEGEHELLGTKVAVKILNPLLSANAQIRERFINEAKMMASLNHPNITRVVDFDDQPNRLSILMEYLEGKDLSDTIKSKSPMKEKELESIFQQTLVAFDYAHSKGIVHRDIKPSNIFLLPNGEVKILDFGIAKLFGQGLEMTQTGTQVGTPIYMSPEQVKADKSIDHRSDIYSLGVTLYFALIGKTPYDVTVLSQFDVFNKIVYEPLPDLSDKGKLGKLIDKACQKDREQRFQSCMEWLDELKSESSKHILNKEKTLPYTRQNSQIENAAKPILGGLMFPEKSDNPIHIEWVEIPESTFMMGSPTSEVDRYDNEVQHQVTLSAFKMSKNEVTFEQYDAFCEATGRKKPKDEGWGRGSRPVINVSWDDANEFASWINCRLPTEAEWECACRAGSSTPFNTGYNLSTLQSNYDGNYSYENNAKGQYLEKTLPIGSYPSNAWGLNDMHGNVWEWCSDLYGEYNSGTQINPKGSTSGSRRVIRGGSWYGYARYCRSANRNFSEPKNNLSILGFRLVFT